MIEIQRLMMQKSVGQWRIQFESVVLCLYVVFQEPDVDAQYEDVRQEGGIRDLIAYWGACLVRGATR
jgi:hypothetical protein